jgi:hypothetical protein
MVLVTFAETKVTRVRADARMKINYREAIHKKAAHAVTTENHSLTAIATV